MKLFYILLLCIPLLLSASEKPKLIAGSYYQISDSQATSLESETNLQARYDQLALVFFSNNSFVFLKEGTELSFQKKSLEHIPNSTDYYFTLNVIEGNVYFRSASIPSESSVWLINTNSAEIEVHATEFSVEAGDRSTYIRCFKGSISLTDGRNFKVTTVEEGEVAIVTSSDGEKNTLIQKYKLSEYELTVRKEIEDKVKSPDVEWTIKDNRYVIKRCIIKGS